MTGSMEEIYPGWRNISPLGVSPVRKNFIFLLPLFNGRNVFGLQFLFQTTYLRLIISTKVGHVSGMLLLEVLPDPVVRRKDALRTVHPLALVSQAMGFRVNLREIT